MESNTKGAVHVGCPCARCRAGIGRVRTEKERKARREWKRTIERALAADGGEELILQPGKTGYTD